MRTRGRVDNRNDYVHKSLNKTKRQRELLRVTHENQVSCQQSNQLILLGNIYGVWSLIALSITFVGHFKADLIKRTTLQPPSMGKDLFRTVPTNSKVFFSQVMNMREKQILASVIKIQKGKWGVTMHFSKIINNICKKLLNTKQCMAFFSKLKLNYLWKMCGYPQFSFWIPIVLAEFCFLCIVLNCTKISCIGKHHQ